MRYSSALCVTYENNDGMEFSTHSCGFKLFVATVYHQNMLLACFQFIMQFSISNRSIVEKVILLHSAKKRRSNDRTQLAKLKQKASTKTDDQMATGKQAASSVGKRVQLR